MPFCNDCGGYIFSVGRKHVCPPIFEVLNAEYGSDDDWVKIRGVDAEDAAKNYAEKDDCDSAEYSIVSGSDAEIWVREVGESEVKKFMVSGETVPRYHAKEL